MSAIFEKASQIAGNKEQEAAKVNSSSFPLGVLILAHCLGFPKKIFLEEGNSKHEGQQ